jgi:hypothetical protein
MIEEIEILERDSLSELELKINQSIKLGFSMKDSLQIILHKTSGHGLNNYRYIQVMVKVKKSS